MRRSCVVLFAVSIVLFKFADVCVADDAALVRDGIIQRVTADADAVRSQAQQAGQTQLVSDLTAIIASAAQLPAVTNPTTYKGEFPLPQSDGLHAQVFQKLAALWRTQGASGLMVWQSGLWEPLPLIPEQVPSASEPAINVTMMQNEYRAGSFNLTNAGAADLAVSLRIDWPVELTTPPAVTVHQVAWTDARTNATPASFQAVAAALPEVEPIGGAYGISVPSGMTRQVWLTFHCVAVDPGSYTGSLVVDDEEVGTINLRVSALEFPAQPTLSVGGWDYTDGNYYGVGDGNRCELMRHLRERFVDTAWGHPYTSIDVDPNPSFAGFDAWVGNWQNACGTILPMPRKYYLFASVPTTFAGYDPRTQPEQFNAAVADWIETCAARWNRVNGLNNGQIALLLRDEPNEGSNWGSTQVILDWANAIKAAQPTIDVQIWEDPVYTDPANLANPPTYTTEQMDLILDMFGACDILCPNRPVFINDPSSQTAYRAQRDAGKTLQFYSCRGPARLLDPYSYHRLQAWTCWQEKARAMFFWAFGDNRSVSSWTEYLASMYTYTPLFLDSQSVTAGKHMEAIREGVEDFEYFVMLQASIDDLNTAGNHPQQVSDAQTFLNTAVANVLAEAGTSLASLYWSDPKDRDLADQTRVQVLDRLEGWGLFVRNVDTGQKYETIQEAINDAGNGNTIEVGAGTYYERIAFGGKNITVRSTDPDDADMVAATTIDGDANGTVVTFDGTETSATLAGLTITNGSAGGVAGGGSGVTISHCVIRDNSNDGELGGGINACAGTITDCIIRDNTAAEGAGMQSCSGTIRRCVITGNVALGDGGGLNRCGTIENCTISGNTANYGGGVAVYGTLRNCLISDNTGGGLVLRTYSLTNCTIAGNSGFGVAVENGDTVTLTNCIVWGNSTSQLDVSQGGTIIATYCDVQGGWSGTGNINSNPPFVDSTTGDYHLQGGSPCLDAGDPNGTYAGQTDLDGRTRVLGTNIDMGAYEAPGLSLTNLWPSGGLSKADLRIVFSGAIRLPLTGAPVTIQEIISFDPLDLGDDVAGNLVYAVATTALPDDTLVIDNMAAVLTPNTWYRVEPVAALGVHDFQQDFLNLPGDIDGSGVIDVVDLLSFLDAYPSAPEDVNYDARCDLNDDNSIDVVDLMIFFENWPE